jgi:hypothetical protein
VKLPVCGKLKISNTLDSSERRMYFMGGFVFSKLRKKKAPQSVELFKVIALA